MAGRSKSTERAQMVRATPTLLSMGHVVEQLGRLGIENSLLIPSQRKAARALRLLGLELLEKQAEADGAEKAGHASTRTQCKRNSNGR